LKLAVRRRRTRIGARATHVIGAAIVATRHRLASEWGISLIAMRRLQWS
jgi:hypothetical protein